MRCISLRNYFVHYQNTPANHLHIRSALVRWLLGLFFYARNCVSVPLRYSGHNLLSAHRLCKTRYTCYACSTILHTLSLQYSSTRCCASHCRIFPLTTEYFLPTLYFHVCCAHIKIYPVQKRLSRWEYSRSVICYHCTEYSTLTPRIQHANYFDIRFAPVK